MIRATHFAIPGLALSLVGCATFDTWQLDDPAGDPVSVRRLEERMDRFLRSVEVEGEVKDWYTLNGYYMVVRTPLHLRSTFRTRIPYVACSGIDHMDPLEMQGACRLLDLPITSTSTSSREPSHEAQH